MAFIAAMVGALALGGAVVQDDPEIDCDNAGSTMEQNHCAAKDVEALYATLKLYTDTAYGLIRETADGDPEALIAEIKAGEQAWQKYVDEACYAVHTNWSGGTIRTVMELSCRMELVRERTHHIWREYLVTMEGLAKLPEPERTEYDFSSES